MNYGASIGHIPVRMRVMGDTGDFLPADAGKDDFATPGQIEEIARRIREGLDQGAPAVGFGFPYTPAATDEELLAAMSVAGEAGASAHVHTYGWADGARYAIDLAAQGGRAAPPGARQLNRRRLHRRVPRGGAGGHRRRVGT